MVNDDNTIDSQQRPLIEKCTSLSMFTKKHDYELLKTYALSLN
jgi:hypothetical protein